MCTVTIVPQPGRSDAFRMACSRDESHGRAPAKPPTPFGKPDHPNDLGYLMPLDPASGGTWVAVNEAGVALTLLNYNLPTPPIDRDRSRGQVIPALLEARSVQDAIWRARDIDRERMMPFRLVICDGHTLMLWRSTEPIDQAEVTDWDHSPVMFTSSGLGDHLVEGPRRVLFEEWFGDDPVQNFDKQRAFHQHQWPGREHLSVNMYRDDARTVSYTVVDVEPAEVTMRYYPDGPADTNPPILHGLGCRRVQR